MKILVLNGSLRCGGNTDFLVDAFRKGAEEKGHEVKRIDLRDLKIADCKGCGACKGNGGNCVNQDDMQKVYPLLKAAEVVILASPIYYWNLTGLLQTTISRFYAPYKMPAKKFGMILSSGSDGVYDAPISQLNSIVSYFKTESVGIHCIYGRKNGSEEAYKELFEFGKSI